MLLPHNFERPTLCSQFDDTSEPGGIIGWWVGVGFLIFDQIWVNLDLVKLLFERVMEPKILARLRLGSFVVSMEEHAGLHAHDEGAEKAVLGILLTNSRELVTEARRRLQGEDFYYSHHQEIFKACLFLDDSGDPIESLSVASLLASRNLLNVIPDGAVYLTELFSNAPTTTSMIYYVEQVKDAATRRKVAVLGVHAQQMSRSTSDASPAAIIEQLRTSLDILANDRISSDLPSFEDVVDDTLREIEFLQTNGAVMGIATGFTELDETLSGLHPGQMIIIAARPGIGKALALDTPVPTPNGGWVMLGDVQVGDWVCQPGETSVKVVAVSDIMVGRPCYQIVFSNGETIVADENHLWVTTTRYDTTPTTRSTRFIAEHVDETHTLSPTGRNQPVVVKKVTLVDSVPVKCIRVDSVDGLFLVGVHKIPTHNSALALDIARNAAIRQDKSVLIFSLEMSKSELGMRALSAEAYVDAKLLRQQNGLDESGWEKLLKASKRMHKKMLGIDDDATVTMADIRAKSRMWKRNNGLDLIIIDYLQLMNPTDKSPSRQQEVSEISRAVKLLAKELQVPVIALSQLNRGPEQRQDKKPVISDLRESGCLTGDTQITRSDTGETVTFQTLFDTGARNIPVWALNTRAERVEPAVMSHVFSTGLRETFRVTTLSGRHVYATGNHPLRTISEWVPVDKLVVGDLVATVDLVTTPSNDNTSMDNSNVLWDKIVSIRSNGLQHVFDATVPKYHNFVANSIVVHNSLEQDADVILLLHREDAYDRESPRAGEADIIIAKQRSGPTGQVTLSWLGKYSRFDNRTEW